MRACFLPAVVVAVLIGPAAATAQTGGPADAPKKLVTKVFSVAELVVPVPDFDSRSAAPEKEKWKTPSAAEAGEQLIRLVAGTVRPCSWGAMGGPGKVEFHEIGFALVVTNTPEVVAEVG
ncbi:MAG TPA: hypothetical protein VKE74_10720, partial [Gemmataceae bacterium]|nr:hypothetical protein [Gemmataceae bacterium]